MNIKYRHRNCDRAFTPATFAYELPPAALFEKMIMESEHIVNFPFGVTYLPKKDQYSRAKGRESALRNHKVTSFILNKIYIKNKRTVFELATYPFHEIELTFSVDFNNDKIRLDHVDLLDNKIMDPWL